MNPLAIILFTWGRIVESAGAYNGSSTAELQSWLDNDVVWLSAPKTAAEVEAAEAAYLAHVAAIQQKNLDDAVDDAQTKGDAAIQALIAKRPAEIDTWVDANITDLASARNLFKKIIKVIRLYAKKEFE